MELRKIQGGFGSNVRNNRFANELDYSQEFDTVQMTITLCSVPYDVGEIHIGNRQIGGRGNVVGWESEQSRDAYFASKKDKYSFQTKFRKFHGEDWITLPVPFYAITKYNYVIVEHEPFTTSYGQSGEVTKFFYFIRDMEMISPNSTKISILRDDWTTYVCRIAFKQLSMVRGHYAVANSDVERFLSNPLENSMYLLEPTLEDVGRGRVGSFSPTLLNSGDMLAVFCFDMSLAESQDYGLSPLSTSANTESALGLELIAVGVSDISAFVSAIPKAQFKAVRWAAVLPKPLLSLGDAFEYKGVTAQKASTGITVNETLLTLDRSKFGYDARYSELAKLYTYPYAELAIYNQDGAETIVRIEDTTGTIKANGALSAMLDGIGYSMIVEGIGATSRSYSIKAIDNRTVNIGGSWVNYDWRFPTYALIQDPYDTNDVDTKSDRDARVTITNENNHAASTNTGTQNAANTANAAIANNAITENTATDNGLLFDTEQLSNGIINQTANSEIDAANAQASVSNTSNLLNGMASVWNSTQTYQIGEGAQSVGAAISNVTNAFTAGANSAATNIATNLKSTQTYWYTYQNSQMMSKTVAANNAKRDTAIGANTDTTDTSNAAASAITSTNCEANSANCHTANNAILAQGRVNEPQAFGTANNMPFDPMGLFIEVRTASKDAIRRAGDDFLRYGYPFSGVIDFETFNVMPKFSYWQIDDMWNEPSGLPDRAMDGIRFLLMGGVTVWREEYIDEMGSITIYDN